MLLVGWHLMSGLPPDRDPTVEGGTKHNQTRSGSGEPLQPTLFRAYRGDESYLFISYSHRDSERVIPLLESWNHAGRRIWYDEGIQAGEEWPEEIAQALQRCARVLVFISPHSVESIHVRNEIGPAYANLWACSGSGSLPMV